MKHKSKKVLLVTTQFVEKYISGLTNRFVGLALYIDKSESRDKIYLLTNKTLWDKCFNGAYKGKSTILKARLSLFRFTSKLYYPFVICATYYWRRCTSIHISSSIVDPLILIRLFNFLGIKYCYTFPSNSIEMGAYGSERMKRKLTSILSAAKNVDILNPTHNLRNYSFKEFISPCSFPYINITENIPITKLLNEKRDNSVVFCGSLIPQKNPLLALQGFQYYLEHYSTNDVTLVFIGEGELFQNLNVEAKAINAKFGRKVIRFEPYNLLINILSQSKVFLSLQDYDNYPSQSTMEAMLFGNYIISIDNGDTRKLVREENGNLLLDNKSPDSLASAINALIKKESINRSNHDLIINDFTAEKYSAYFFNIHDNLS